MVIIESVYWGDFVGIDLQKAKDKIVSCLYEANSEDFQLVEVVHHGNYLSKSLVREIEFEIEQELRDYQKKALREQEGYYQAQTEIDNEKL